ncbi:uracil-DNA glycosylase family protein [Rhodospira trueperi]|uniref:Uracil-DNA glycosylase n=1 Tax=Rhodospira trueperi TaxID=69960 RepID=A0A1G7B3X7_9PROT|nr:uracil-DNA glycosylase family protein [Rhodospira trueperi]SDE21610.1 Uracil-DNA glycosylase [Rhodospira trueperi]
MPTLDETAAAARACTLCADHLPLGPRPVLRARGTARILVIGQAPGTKVHATGLPWNDPSGDRLRAWMGVDRETFYDDRRIAIIPIGLCYPGRLPRGGDAPPRPECAPTWHPALLAGLPDVALTLLVGQYAQARYLGEGRGRTLTETVRAFAAPLEGAGLLPLPHPSWRNTAWLRRHPWFEAELLPVLRDRLATLLERP